MLQLTIVNLSDTHVRYMSLGVSLTEIHLSAHVPNSGLLYMDIPRDDEMCAETRATPGLTNCGIVHSPRPTTRLGPFCRAIEAARLLGECQDLIAKSASSSLIDKNRSNNLDKSLHILAMSLFQQSVNGWEECCAAIGLCLR
jgi:hypothetical protein